ncbi:MAG TPA: hypothetical protein ACHBX0_02335 [Arsenophonus sp.]
MILRYYACASLEKAYKLDPTLLSESKFNNWKNRLLGKDGVFTYTAVLVNLMTDHASEYCKDIFQKINSPAW